MTLEQFEKDLEEKLAGMTDEQLKTSLRRAGCTFEDFKQEFDATIGKMSEPELIAAMERAGVKFEDNLLVEYKSPAGPYWYHPDHPMCQDGQVLWEFPEGEE